MALGKPVIATDCAGNTEVIRNGETGFLVPAFSPESIAQRVVELLGAPHRARQMGEAGQQRVIEAYSMHRMVTEYEALYDLMLRDEKPT